MPSFQVLRCYKCMVFQVHQTKKSIKWDCKLCGQKQSIKRHYGIGTGKDCRIHVQKLNAIRGEIDELKCSRMERNQVSDGESDLDISHPEKASIMTEHVQNSKWSNYIEESELSEETNNELTCLGDAQIVLEIPKKRKKQMENLRRKENFVVEIKRNNLTNDTINNHSSCIEETTSSNNINKPIGEVLPTASSIQFIEKDNSNLTITKRKFVPPVINKSSKWAQYSEIEEENIEYLPAMNMSRNELMFSQCGDTDLDKVLDI